MTRSNSITSPDPDPYLQCGGKKRDLLGLSSSLFPSAWTPHLPTSVLPRSVTLMMEPERYLDQGRYHFSSSQTSQEDLMTLIPTYSQALLLMEGPNTTIRSTPSDRLSDGDLLLDPSSQQTTSLQVPTANGNGCTDPDHPARLNSFPGANFHLAQEVPWNNENGNLYSSSFSFSPFFYFTAFSFSRR